MAEFTKEMKGDLRIILYTLVKNLTELRERKDQPEFNKGLDAICDYDEAIEKILDRTGAPRLYEALKALVEYHKRTGSAIPCLADALQALALVEGKE
jgi:hypothetical protein